MGSHVLHPAGNQLRVHLAKQRLACPVTKRIRFSQTTSAMPTTLGSSLSLARRLAPWWPFSPRPLWSCYAETRVGSGPHAASEALQPPRQERRAWAVEAARLIEGAALFREGEAVHVQQHGTQLEWPVEEEEGGLRQRPRGPQQQPELQFGRPQASSEEAAEEEEAGVSLETLHFYCHHSQTLTSEFHDGDSIVALNTIQGAGLNYMFFLSFISFYLIPSQISILVMVGRFLPELIRFQHYDLNFREEAYPVLGLLHTTAIRAKSWSLFLDLLARSSTCLKILWASPLISLIFLTETIWVLPNLP